MGDGGTTVGPTKNSASSATKNNSDFPQFFFVEGLSLSLSVPPSFLSPPTTAATLSFSCVAGADNNKREKQ